MSKKLGRPKKKKKDLAKAVLLTLSPEAIKILKKINKGERSQFVSDAILLFKSRI